jgi:hypothetical protein
VGTDAAVNRQDFGTSRWQFVIEPYTNFPRLRKRCAVSAPPQQPAANSGDRARATRGDRHGKLDADQLAPAPRAPRGEHLDQRLAHHLCVRSGCSDDDSPGWHDEVGRPRAMDRSGVRIDPNAEIVTAYCSASRGSSRCPAYAAGAGYLTLCLGIPRRRASAMESWAPGT